MFFVALECLGVTENEVEWKRACEREVGCPLVSAGCGVVIFFSTAICVSPGLFRPAILVLLFPRVVTGGNKGKEVNFVRKVGCPLVSAGSIIGEFTFLPFYACFCGREWTQEVQGRCGGVVMQHLPRDKLWVPSL